MGGGHPSLAAIAARSEVSPINRRIGLMARPAAATLSPEIHAPKELIKTRTAMKGLEVLLPIQIGIFGSRSRTASSKSVSAGSASSSAAATSACLPAGHRLPIRRLLQSGPQTLRGLPAAGTHIHPREKRRIEVARLNTGERFLDQSGAFFMASQARGCRSVVDEQLQGRCARRGCPRSPL
jgi:hypothetical protein